MAERLPIGSVVELAGKQEDTALIIGYLPQDSSTERIFDYLAVAFPSGLTDINEMLLINSNLITKVVYVGYKDESCEKLLNSLDEFDKNIIGAFEK